MVWDSRVPAIAQMIDGVSGSTPCTTGMGKKNAWAAETEPVNRARMDQFT